MKAHKRISDIRKQSRIVSPKQSLWFLSDERLMNQSSGIEKRSLRNDRASIYNDDYTRYGQGNTGLPRTNKECSFVVDWQMSDTF
jgi:vacuolar-type H+-ATPase subunit B/Vma2